MNIKKQAREETAAKRQEEKHLQDRMSVRAEEEVRQTTEDLETAEQAREKITARRQQDEHRRETMLNRSQAEISTRPESGS